MAWWQISIITLLVYWIIGVIVYKMKGENEDFAIVWSMGMMFLIIWILCYPIREWNQYKNYIEMYKKHKLTYWDRLIGKGLYEGHKMWRWEIKKILKEKWESE